MCAKTAAAEGSASANDFPIPTDCEPWPGNRKAVVAGSKDTKNHLASGAGQQIILGAFDFYDLFASVMPAIWANMMGAMLFAAVGAIYQVLGLNGVMRPATIASAL